MRQFLLLAPIAALALSACAPEVQLAGSAPAPAPNVTTAAVATSEALAVPTVDEVAIDRAFRAFDVFLYAVDFAQAVGKLKAGSPTSRMIADHVEKVRTWLNAASQAQWFGRAIVDGKPVSAAAAFAFAEAAFKPIRAQLAK